MKLLDRIAINSLVKTITSFILAVLKIFQPTNTIEKPKRRPLRDLLDKVLKK